jgi:RNA polymerase sigma-70 factor (ECF subfamily)
MGRFQLEAAIQSAHAQRARTGQTDWSAIELLYEGLVRIALTIGAHVGRAAAVAETRGPAIAWNVLQTMPADRVTNYQPY